MNRTPFIISLCISLILGLMIVSSIIYYDDDINAALVVQFKDIFKQQFLADFDGELQSLEIYEPKLIFKNVTVRDCYADEWSWQAEEFILGFSWLDALLTRAINLSIVVNRVAVHSQMNEGAPAIAEHIQQFFIGSSDLPYSMKHLHVKKAQVNLTHPHATFLASVDIQGSFFNEFTQLNIYLDGGILKKDTTIVAQNLETTLRLKLVAPAEGTRQCSLSGKVSVPALKEPDCTLSGNWHDGKGQLILNNSSRSFVVALYNILHQEDDLTGSLQCSFPLKLVHPFMPSFLQKLSGDLSAHGRGSLYDLSFTVSCNLDKACYGNHALGSVQSIIKKNGPLVVGKSSLATERGVVAQSTLHYNLEKRMGEWGINNIQHIPLANHWAISEKKGYCVVKFNKGIYQFICNGECANELEMSEIPFSWSGTFDGIKSSLQGNLHDYKLDLAANFKPLAVTGSIVNVTRNDKPIVMKIYNDRPYKFKVTGDVDPFKRMALNLFNIKVQGFGKWVVEGIVDFPYIKARTSFYEGSIMIPGMFNAMHSAGGKIVLDIAKKEIVIKQLRCIWNKGLIACKQARLCFTPQGDLSYVNIPLTIERLFLNKQQEAFAIISGLLQLSKDKDHEVIRGNIIIDRGQIKENIFSKNFQQTFLPHKSSYDRSLDIKVQTKSPMHIKTPLIQTQAHVDMSIKGSIMQPNVLGSIDLSQGFINFPYKPLMITSGKLFFLPHQLEDPFVELVAKGTIRNHHITLRCFGSVRSPQILLESSPPLTEEQILALLIAGSHEGALSFAVPAMAIGQLQNLLFGSQSETKFERYFKNIFKPLRHIRFIPGFTDQTARGGFRGTIEIDVNDQLRAFIQKNFSLTEDTKLQVEYYLTDDITIRGIRDQRGDLGGEVEVRMKF